MNKLLLILSFLVAQTLYVYAAASKGDVTVENLNALAQQVKNLDKRLQKIERLLNNKILIETVNRLDDLQAEIKEVRGDVEGIGFKVESATKRNKSFFIDTDRRLNNLEVIGKRAAEPITTGKTQTVKPIKAKVQSESKVLIVKTKTNEKTPPVKNISDQPKVVINKQLSEVSADERKDYMAAFNYLKQGRYQKSLIAFSEFLDKHPNGRYADNAQYWLAESNYVSRFFDQAIIEFKKVITLYPSSPKVADARLKLGYSYYERGMWAKAKNSFETLIVDYPKTSIANLAKRRLKRIEREGH